MCTSESESMKRNVYNESKLDQIWFHVDLKKYLMIGSCTLTTCLCVFLCKENVENLYLFIYKYPMFFYVVFVFLYSDKFTVFFYMLYSRGRQCRPWSADVLQSLAPTLRNTSPALISLFRCVWLGLELNSTGQQLSRTDVTYPCYIEYIIFKQITNKKYIYIYIKM